jgi:hypothetical protein
MVMLRLQRSISLNEAVNMFSVHRCNDGQSFNFLFIIELWYKRNYG